jgi:hypothetical protein
MISALQPKSLYIMTSKLNLRQTVIDFLKGRPEERFTARQLAIWMFDNLRANSGASWTLIPAEAGQ